MKRFVVSSGWALLALAALSAASAGSARAGGPHAVGIPGIGPGTGVDVYLPNPDPQTPIAWSQGTEPPPPQGDYGGGILQYMVTGSEAPPAPHPRVPPPYFPARPVPGLGSCGGGAGCGGYAPGRGAYGPPAYPPQGYAPARRGGGFGFGAASPLGYNDGPGAGPVASYAPAAFPGGQPRAGLDPAFRRQEVAYGGGERPGTVVIDTSAKFLYLVEGSGRAVRYGIGVAMPGFLWSGTHAITRKAEWPDWTPPAEMIGRRPDLPRHMAGGIGNPLGARALYLGSTLYRIHGTNDPSTIGTNVSSGCIRLTNDDVTDLYGRVGVGTRVVVL